MGGGDGDGGAAAIAEANARAAREAAQAEQARWEREQKRIADEKAAEKLELAQQEAKRQQQIQYEREEAARQAEALAKTGTPNTSFIDTRSDKAKAYAAASAGLPGFGDLKNKFTQTPQPTGAFSGQSNLPIGTFNASQAGGRKYV